MNYLEILSILSKIMQKPLEILPQLKELIDLIKELPEEDIEDLSIRYPKIKIIIDKIKLVLLE